MDFVQYQNQPGVQAPPQAPQGAAGPAGPQTEAQILANFPPGSYIVPENEGALTHPRNFLNAVYAHRGRNRDSWLFYRGQLRSSSPRCSSSSCNSRCKCRRNSRCRCRCRRSVPHPPKKMVALLCKLISTAYSVHERPSRSGIADTITDTHDGFVLAWKNVHSSLNKSSLLMAIHSRSLVPTTRHNNRICDTPMYSLCPMQNESPTHRVDQGSRWKCEKVKTVVTAISRSDARLCLYLLCLELLACRKSLAYYASRRSSTMRAIRQGDSTRAIAMYNVGVSQSNATRKSD